MTLHIITRSDSQSQSIHHCLTFISENDVVLFVEDGTYCLLNITLNEKLKRKNIKCCYLQPDISARGLVTSNDINVVNYSDFVTLTEKYHPSQTWG